MGVEYDRIERESINHPATIGDIPFEVIKNALRHLIRSYGREDDLVYASLSCRAWRQAAAELILDMKRFVNSRAIESFACGMMLKNLVFGFDQYSIKKLDLEIPIEVDHAYMMAQVVSRTLSSLSLYFVNDEDGEVNFNSEGYDVLEIFLSRCLKIRSLGLYSFDFGADPSSLNSSIKEGFGRLRSLRFLSCRGNLVMFMGHVPIQNLSKFEFDGAGKDSILFYQLQ
jgi:hypothetical protein